MTDFRRPAVAFEMNLRDSSVGPHRVHELIHEVYRRMGNQAAGAIGVSQADQRGTYMVAFEHRATADAFARLYRSAGGNSPRESRRSADDMVMLHGHDSLMLAILGSVEGFIGHLLGQARRAHLN